MLWCGLLYSMFQHNTIHYNPTGPSETWPVMICASTWKWTSTTKARWPAWQSGTRKQPRASSWLPQNCQEYTSSHWLEAATAQERSVQHFHFNSLTSSLTSTFSLQHSRFNTLTSTVSLQHSRFNTLTSTLSLQHSHFNTFTSTLSLQHSHFNTLTSTLSPSSSTYNLIYRHLIKNKLLAVMWIIVCRSTVYPSWLGQYTECSCLALTSSRSQCSCFWWSTWCSFAGSIWNSFSPPVPVWATSYRKNGKTVILLSLLES